MQESNDLSTHSSGCFAGQHRGVPCLPALVWALNDLTGDDGGALDSKRGAWACGHDVARLNNLTGSVAVENTGSRSPGTLFIFHLLCLLRRRTDRQPRLAPLRRLDLAPSPLSPLPSPLSSPLAPFFPLRFASPFLQARTSQHGVTNRVRSAQGAHQAPFDAQEAVPS